MKKIILPVLVFLLIIQITLAICCNTENGLTGGCYPGRPICCEEETSIVGYSGCEAALNPNDPNDYSYYCPEEYLGPCLQCSENCLPNGDNCDWVELNNACDAVGSCVISYLPSTKIPSLVTECSDKCNEGEVWDSIIEECVLQDGTLKCKNNDCMPNKWCCDVDGKFKQMGIGAALQGGICSGDNDADGICNFYDNCPDISNPNQEDDDNDGIGDDCEYETKCYSPYGDRMCCDDLPYSQSGIGQFYGYTDDCPQTLGGIGCWTNCQGVDPSGNIITYEVGQCIDEERTVKTIDQNGNVLEVKKEPCAGIPLIPFFTTINMLVTFLILISFYYFKEK
jgi:hypothetical protein